MTNAKQNVECPVRDGPELSWGGRELGSFQKEIESFNDVGMKSIHRSQNTLPFKGLSLLESYIKGILWIAVEYRPPAADKIGVSGVWILLNGQGNAGNGVTCFPSKFISDLGLIRDNHISCRWDKHMVLVGDVQKMQSIEAELPGFVRLYLIDNNVIDCIGRRQSLEFLSIDGTFKRLPVLAEREERVSCNSSPIFLDHNAISVIEGSPEVMQRIAQDCRCMFGERSGRPGALPLQKLVIMLGSQSIYTVRDVLFENSFEAVDVMFGPFYL